MPCRQAQASREIFNNKTGCAVKPKCRQAETNAQIQNADKLMLTSLDGDAAAHLAHVEQVQTLQDVLAEDDQSVLLSTTASVLKADSTATGSEAVSLTGPGSSKEHVAEHVASATGVQSPEYLSSTQTEPMQREQKPKTSDSHQNVPEEAGAKRCAGLDIMS